MQISDKGVDFICRWEGFKPKAYKDVAGLWTIGYGHLIKPDEEHLKGAVLTEASAKELMYKDAQTAVVGVKKALQAVVQQHQFDALVSFTYNVGNKAFGDSSLLKHLNAGDFTKAADEFLRWNKAGGRVVQGLTNRRTSERTLFLTGDYNA